MSISLRYTSQLPSVSKIMERRLVLIAMSGVRIVDPELLALGITLPGFVERGKVIASLPSLGLLTIAGATPAHWEIEYHEIDELCLESLHQIAESNPDLVAVSSLTARVYDAYSVLKIFRDRSIKTVLGGLHASVLPEEAAKHADVVVQGQGEWLWPKVIADFESGNLASRYSGMFAGESLDSSPMPRWDLIDIDKYNRLPLQSSRGCPLDCSFCGASRLISHYKKKSITRVRAEIESILALWSHPFIELADDNTFVDKKWGLELACLFAEYPRIRWFTESDISLASKPELLGKLAESGCAQVLIGLESISPDSLKEADSGQWKKRQQVKYKDAIATIQDHGISVNGCFAFGFDGDTIESFSLTDNFIQESCLTEVQLTLLTPFPGTALYEKLKQEKRLFKEEFWNQCTLFDLTFHPKGMSAEELRQMFKILLASVYSKERSRQRESARYSLLRGRREVHH